MQYGRQVAICIKTLGLKVSDVPSCIAVLDFALGLLILIAISLPYIFIYNLILTVTQSLLLTERMPFCKTSTTANQCCTSKLIGGGRPEYYILKKENHDPGTS